MADARKTWAQLDVLFATNGAGAISAQDLRDGFQSLEPHVAAAAPTVDDDETDGFDTDHAWIDTSTSPRSLYRCLDPSTGAAVWAKVYPVEAAGDVAAEDVTYDNGTSGLAAEDVQAAIDELASEKADTSSLGTAAAANVDDFATAAQGGLADTALQPSDVGTMAAENAADYLPSRAVTQSEYDGLSPVAGVLYVITDA